MLELAKVLYLKKEKNITKTIGYGLIKRYKKCKCIYCLKPSKKKC